MRTIIFVFFIFFAIFFCVQWGFNYFVPPYQSIAIAFFDLIEKNNYQSAYNLMSSNFKTQVDLKHFQDFIENSEYREYQGGRWFDVVMKQDTGTMKGVITLKSNKQLPLGFSFLKEKAYRVKVVLPLDQDRPIGEFSSWKIDKIWHLDLDKPVTNPGPSR